MAQIQLPPVIRRWRLLAAVTAVTALAGGGVLLAASSDPATAVAFHTVETTRVFDSREGTGVPLGANAIFDVGIPNLPDDVTAVGVNVTIVDGSAASFLTVYPTGDARPPTSTINWSSAGAVANSATVVLHRDHSLRLYNMNGTVHVVIDLLGYYSPSPAGGATGPAGATGAAGATGTIGATGPKGDPGSRGSDGVAVRLFRMRTTLGSVSAGAPVVFNSPGQPSTDFSVSGGGGAFTATAAGVYRVTFGVVSSDNSSFRIATGLTPSAFSWAFSGFAYSPVSGTALLTLAAGEDVSIVNGSGIPVALVAPSAWIVIEKM